MTRDRLPFLLICLFLAGWAIPARGAYADDAAEIAQLKQQMVEMQKRLQALEEKQKKEVEEKAKAPQPVWAGFGKIKIGGLLQNWYSIDTRNPDTFRLRRMELNISGEITPRVSWRTMFDTAKVLGLNTTIAGGNVTSVSVNQASRVLQDMLISYKVGSALGIDVGQYKVPLSMEGLRSSSELLTVERAIFNTLPARRGRVGDVRDPGLQLRGTYPRAEFALGLFNDSGPRQNDVDDNDQKSFIGRFAYRPVAKDGQMLHLGVYGATGGTTPARVRRDRIGGEFAYHHGSHTLEAEFVEAKDGSSVIRSQGGYVVYAYALSKAWQGVARWETWDPDTDASGNREHDWLVGANYYLKGKNAKLQFNFVRKNIGSKAPDFLGKSRSLFLINLQTAW
ncbi:MAG: hypothetical protein HY320_05035 [Armatimonadetes bacterium]|nr:hypothetical protein [Armatimonadota bacterium]